MYILKCAYLNNVWIPYCTSSDFPRTIFNCAYYSHAFWTIHFVRILEFSSQIHQIDCISKLWDIGKVCPLPIIECRNRLGWSWMIFVSAHIWENPNDSIVGDSLDMLQWGLTNGGNMCRVWNNNRCWGTAKKTGKEIDHPSAYVWKLIKKGKLLWEDIRYLVRAMKPAPPSTHWQT